MTVAGTVGNNAARWTNVSSNKGSARKRSEANSADSHANTNNDSGKASSDSPQTATDALAHTPTTADTILGSRSNTGSFTTHATPASNITAGSTAANTFTNAQSLFGAAIASASAYHPSNANTLGRGGKGDTQPTGKSSKSDAAEVINAFQQQFAQSASNREKFHALTRQSFGDSYDQAAAEHIRQQTLNGDFSWIPEIVVVDAATLADQSGTQSNGVALGAYSSTNNTIYLNRELLQRDPARALEILTEEVGHGLDQRLNTSDAAGDEGEIFAQLMSGKDLSQAELSALRTQNDSGAIVIDGQRIEVEYGFSLSSALSSVSNAVSSATSSISNAVSSAADSVGNVIESVGNAVSNTVQSVAGAVNDGIASIGGLVSDGLHFVADNVLQPVLQATGPVGNFLNDHVLQPTVGYIDDVIDIGVNGLQTGVDVVQHVIGGVINVSTSLLTGDLAGAWNNLAGIAGNVINDIAGFTIETLAMQLHALASFLNSTFGLSETRGLTATEREYLQSIYGNSLDYDAIRIQSGGIESLGSGMDAHTVGNDIYLPDGNFDSAGNLTPAGLRLLSHEAAHAWQFQNAGAGYLSGALISYANESLGGDDPYDWGSALDEHLGFDSMTPDQQAEFARIIGIAVHHQSYNGVLTTAILNDVTTGRTFSNADLVYLQNIQQRLLSGGA